MKVLLISGKHYRVENGQTVRHVPGEVFEVTQVEYIAFHDRLELVEEKQNLATIDSGEQPDGNARKLPAETPIKAPTHDLSDILANSAAEALAKAGIDSLEKLALVASDPDALAAIPGIGKTKARQIRKALIDLQTAEADNG